MAGFICLEKFPVCAFPTLPNFNRVSQLVGRLEDVVFFTILEILFPVSDDCKSREGKLFGFSLQTLGTIKQRASLESVKSHDVFLSACAELFEAFLALIPR